jgi:hypothetical protein
MLTTTTVNVGGRNSNLVIYVPNGTTQKLPAFIFVPGLGEQDGNVNDLYTWGPLAAIKNGWAPNFVVAGIQPPQTWPQIPWLDTMIKAITGNPNYLVDDKSICLTGLSAGANLISYYVDRTATDASLIRPSSVVLFSYGRWDQYAPAAWQDLPAWGLCGDQDKEQYAGNVFFWKRMQDAGMPNKPFSAMVGFGHTGWDQFYKPDFVDASLNVNIYDWALRFAKTPPLPAPVPAPAPRVLKTVINIYSDNFVEVINK